MKQTLPSSILFCLVAGCSSPSEQPVSPPPIQSDFKQSASQSNSAMEEARRRSIFYEIQTKETQAEKEVQQRLPDLKSGSDQTVFLKRIKEQNQLAEDLLTKCREQTGKKYHLSKAEIEDIEKEGVINGWPPLHQ